MANEIITTLHPDQDPDTNLYPNIKKDNIPNSVIGREKLDEDVNNLLSSIGTLTPSGVDTSAHILAFTSNKGIYVGTDTNHWYYWDGTQYRDGGQYLVNIDGIFINTSTAHPELTSFNQFPKNSIVSITWYGNTITDGPKRAFLGNVYTYSYASNSSVCIHQLAVANDGVLYSRFYYASWTNWTTLISLSNLKNNAVTTQYKITDSTSATNLGFTNANNFVANSIASITWYQNTITNLPTSAFTGNVLTFTSYNDLGVCVLQFAVSNGKRLYYRYKYDTWGTWKEILSETQIQTLIDNAISGIQIENKTNFIEMFHKIGVCGDSLSSGEIAYNDGTDHYIDKYEYSWLSNIKRNINVDIVHYSSGGKNAKTWYETYATQVTDETNKPNLYIIALGTNDYETRSGYPLGNITDQSGDNTFVGYYKRIIELIKSVSPNSAIMCLSLYEALSPNTYSNMISSICDLYDGVFYLDFVNESTILLNTSTHVSLGHFDTLGYCEVATNIIKIINDVVEDNDTYFKLFAVNN